MLNTTQGDPLFVLEELKKLRQVIGMPIAVHWYVWYDAPNFDMHYPQYFPAKQDFGRVVQELQQIGVYVMPYINGRIFDVSIRSFFRMFFIIF